MALSIDEVMLSFSESIAHLQFSPTPKSMQRSQRNLMSLPQELFEMILDLAYPNDPRFKYVTRQQWNTKERTRVWRYNNVNTKEPFPTPKLCDFLVSKKYFLARARSYIANQTFDFTSPPRMGSDKLRNGGAAFAFMTTAAMAAHDIGCGDLPSNLRHLTVTISPFDFDIIEPRIPCVHDLEKDDFESVAKTRRFHRLSGLQKFCLQPGRTFAEKGSRKEAIWQANIRRFEAYLRPIVTRQRKIDSNKNVTADNRLYHGSQVLLNTAHPNSSHHRRKVPLDQFPPAATFELTVSRLSHSDIPDNLEDFKSLLEGDGIRVMEWIRKKKQEDAPFGFS